MTERASSQSSGGSRAGTSKNALLSSSSDDAADKWTQATVAFDFDKMHADDFPNFLNDEFSIHKNDEALLADFTALLEDGDDAIMTSANSTINVSDDKSKEKEKEKEKETNKNDANVSTSTSHSLNSSIGEILVTTVTRQSQSEQHSQSIGSIMSDHDYLSRADILEITDEDNFFSQGFPKPMKVENDSMEVNLSGNVPSTLMSQPLAESPDSAAVATANSANEANLPTMAANVADDIAQSIFGDEVMPLLVKLTATKPAETENLVGTMNELEAKMSKWKDSLSRASESGGVSSSVGKTTTSDQSNEGEKPDETTVSECESDPVFMSDRSEPLEYLGTAKAHSGTTTDESDDEFVSKLKAELNTADALTDELRLTLNSYRRTVAPSTAQPISIKLATHLERMSANFLKIAAKFKPPSTDRHLNGPTSNSTEPQATMTESNKLNEKSKEQLLADFSSSSEANSTNDDENGSPRVRRKKKSRGNKLDPSLSQINGIDDEDNILVKNEPLLDTQLLNGDAEAASKAVNVIEELNKWKDYDKEYEGEFYGFDATDTDDCANSSIEVGVKSEPANDSITNSQTERRLEESEATQMYSVEDEIAKANAIATSENSDSTADSTKTSDETNNVESTKEIAEAAPVVNNVADDVKIEEVDKVHSQALLPNGNDDSSSENDASDEMGDDEEDDDDIDADADNDREIARLLDFSSLGVKRKISSTISSATSKVNGTEEPKKKQMKKQKPEDGLDAILRQSQDASDDSDDGASSKSEDDKITEEQYLKEHNLSLKNQLLADTSSDESDFDSETDQDDDSDRPKMNGTHKKGVNSDDESDDSNASGSYESLVDQFLKNDATEIESTEQKSTKNSQRKSSSGSEADKSDISSNSKLTDPKSSPEVNGSIKVANANSATVKAAPVVSSSEKEAENGDKEDNESVDQSSESTDTPKRKAKVVGKMFKALDKELRPLMSSDESDDSDSNKSKKKASSDENSDCEMILDTTLFKDRKKEIDSKQLSKILNSSAKAKATTSRATPDDCISLSSDDELEPISVEKGDDKEASDDDEEGQKNRTGRKLLRTDQLAGETKRAQREETQRVQRLKEKQTRLTQIIESQRKQSQSQRSTQNEDGVEDVIEDIILDYDSKKKENIIVHRDIQKHLKSHQIDGIKFMYDCCYGSVDSLKDHPGSGCILAHCMGLGKTLQLISLLHTVITYPQLKTNKVLVICPKSTVLNWKEEIERWMGPIREGRRLKLFQFADQSGIKEKMGILKEWSGCGKASSKAGCLLLGYEAFRTLVFYHTQKKAVQLFSSADLKKIEDCVYDCLLKRGATDLVICDEGHMIKNQKSTTSLAVNKIETDRRIILTGTPIQNNLKEYYSMVNFIKPSFLGTEKEFNNLYANPIKSGQHKDSSKQEIKVMKQRSYVLHNKLSKFVQRREAALLKTFLPEKYEYVLFIPMTDVQNQLYEYFLENNPLKDKLGGKSLISDYTILRKIWTHPKVLENAYLNALKEENRKREKQRRMNNDEDEDDRPDDFLDSQEGKMSVKNDWWRQHVSEDEHLKTILPSNKLKILFEILKKCEENGEKCLIFSAFVAVLDVVEFFMKEITRQTQEGTTTSSGLENYRGTWKLGDDYYRLDGKTPKSMRHQMITNFNAPKNARARVFLISAKAGGQGINLIGANRVILLDTSWNPSNDQQNIFRVFRLGQKKICYIYRLLAMGTMEEKVYSRSVTKQAMSCRVVDEQQIDRHYNMAELTELYTLVKPDYSERPTPSLPPDQLLAHLLHKFPNMVYKYHEHDSLLERKDEQDLSEAEKADAWAAYEKDATMRNTLSNMGTYNPNFNMAQGAYDNNFASYGNALYGSTFGGSGYSSAMAAYLNQFSPTAFPGPEYQELMRMYSDSYPNPYANYSSLYGGNTSAAASLFNSGMLTSPPPPPTTPSSTSPSSSLLAYNRHSDAISAATYNAATNNYLSSLVNPPSTSKGYSNQLFNSSAMQMLMNSYPTSSSGGGRIPAPVSSPSTSKSPATTASSLLDSSIYAYMQQNNLLFGGSTTTTTASSASPSMSTLANAISGAGGTASSTSSRQGPNAKRNPMLSKELSMMSARTPFFDSLNLPSIATSVITKSPVNLASTTANSSNSTPSPAGDRLVSPEPHLTVKNVSTINQTVTKSTTPPNKSGNNVPSPSGAQMSNKNSVSITSINKKPNAETSSVTSGSSVASSNNSNQQSSSSGSSTTSNSTSSSTGSSGNSSGVVITSAVNSTGNRSTSTSNANPTSRGITNMGISYPDKDRVIETKRDSPTPKAVNMGIVYPMNRPTTNQKPPSMNSKNLATSTSRSTPVEPPMTQLAAVNKVLQQQNMRRTSPNALQPGSSKPSAQSTPSTSVTASPTFPRKMINSSVTVTPVTVPSRPATGAGPSTNSSISKPATGLSLNKRPFNVSTTSKTNLSSSITLSPIPSSASGPQYKTFSRPTPEKDGAGKNNSSKVVLSKTNPTWQSRNHSMTISKTSVPAPIGTTAQSANQSATTSNGMPGIPRALTVTAKANPSNQQQRSSPVIVRNSPNKNQSINNSRGIPSPTAIRRAIVGAKTNPPQTSKPAATIPMNVQSTVPRPIVNSKAVTVNKLPTLRNDLSVQNNLVNRKRAASPRPANANIIGSNSALSITQVKRPRLSLASSNSRPSPIVRTIGAPPKPAVGALQNIRVTPRQPNNTNNSQTDNSQRNVQDISTMEIVELD